MESSGKLFFLGTAPAASCGCASTAPEEAFHDMHAKPARARTLHVSFHTAAKLGEFEPHYKGRFLLEEGNKAFLEVEEIHPGRVHKFGYVSDGAEASFHRVGKTPANLKISLTALFACGPAMKFFEVFDGPPDEGALDRQVESARPSRFAWIEKETILEFMAGADRVNVWIDPKTRLPFKKVIWSGTSVITDSYSDFRIDDKIDPQSFKVRK